jgi:hypothetical protein
VIDMSADTTATEVVAVAVLFPETGSDGDSAAIVAVFVIRPAVAGVVTVIVIAGAVATANAARVHVTTPAAWLHVQPVPVAEPNVTPAGSVSVIVRLAAVLGPAFATVTV